MELRMGESMKKVIDELKCIKEPVDPHKYNSLVALNILCGICFDKT